MTKNENEERFASLKLMATLSGVEAQVKEVLHDFILITYDLPTTEEGNKARAKFLDDIRYIGGVMHSESCYLMPSSPESELAAIQLAEKTPSWKKHAEDGKEAVVNRMRKKTEKMLKDAAGIAARRGSDKLAKEVSRLKSEYEEITVNTAGSWVSELKDLL